MTTAPSKSSLTLWIVGTPLDESASLSEAALAACARANIIIGENRKVTLAYLKSLREALPEKSVFFLDPPRPQTFAEIKEALNALSATGGSVVLMSDVGMPILFDPGQAILDLCRARKFEVRSVAGPTSWGSALALSGFDPPFLLLGFLPRDPATREKTLRAFTSTEAHCVFMDTPYRFRLLLSGLKQTFGKSREVFLAWEISKPTEWLAWGTLDAVEHEAMRRGYEKGEFVIIMKGRK